MTSDSILLDSINDAFVAIDAACRVMRVNPAFERVFGLRPSSSVGRELFSLAENLRRSPFEVEIYAALTKGATCCALDSMVIDGWAFELRTSPLKDGGLALLFIDVTHRVEEDQRMTDALGRLAHDLRNPLAPLRTSLELLNRHTIAEETKARARTIMERQVQEMVRLIDELQDIARGGRSKLAARSKSLGETEDRE